MKRACILITLVGMIYGCSFTMEYPKSWPNPEENKGRACFDISGEYLEFTGVPPDEYFEHTEDGRLSNKEGFSLFHLVKNGTLVTPNFGEDKRGIKIYQSDTSVTFTRKYYENCEPPGQISRSTCNKIVEVEEIVFDERNGFICKSDGVFISFEPKWEVGGRYPVSGGLRERVELLFFKASDGSLLAKHTLKSAGFIVFVVIPWGAIGKETLWFKWNQID